MQTLEQLFKFNSLSFMGRALRYRNYRLFFIGQIISLIGTWMSTIATSWLVYRLTDSAFFLGIFGFLAHFPSFLLAPFAGIFVDRKSRRGILIVTQSLSMVQSFALALLTLNHWITIPWLLALGIFQGLVNAFDMPCRQAFVVEMIEKREDLGNAIALNSSMFNVARIIGPAIGGILIAAVGEGWCFFIDGVSYMAVIISLMSMVVVKKTAKNTQTSSVNQFVEGVKYVARSRPIRSLIILIGLVSLMGVPYTVLMPVFVGTILKGDSRVLGLLMTSAGAGALIGALWLAGRRSVLGLGRVISLSTAAFGLGLITFSFSKVIWISVLCLVIAGGGFMVQMAASNTILQTIVEDDKRGRVMSLFIMAFIGASPLGSLLAGILSERIGVPYTLLLSGVFCLGGAFWFYRQLPELRDAIRPIYKKLGIIQEVQAEIEMEAEFPLPPEE